jgi:hypothetical protein
VACDQAFEHAFKRGAFFGGHVAKELGIILVSEREKCPDPGSIWIG